MHYVVNIDIAEQVQARVLVTPGYHMHLGDSHLSLCLADCMDAQSTILDHEIAQHTACL